MALMISQNNIIGVKFPFTFSLGKVELSSNDQHIEEGLRQLIGTNKFEYLHKPDYGCDLGSRVFDPVNVLALADGDIREAARKFEPRVTIRNVLLNNRKQSEGIVTIVVEFSVKGNQDTLQVEAAEINFGSGGTVNPWDDTDLIGDPIP